MPTDTFRPLRATLAALAAEIDTLARSDVSTTDKGALDWGKRDALVEIHDTAEVIAANAFTREREHGSVNPFRAAVDSLAREYDRTPTVVGREVDPFEGARHHVITAPSHKYPNARKVIGRGVAPVIGAMEATDPDDIRQAMAAHLLTYVKGLRIGLRSIAVEQITNAIWGDVLPLVETGLRRDGSLRQSVMLSTDFEAHKQTFDPSNPACREPIYEHNLFTPGRFDRSGIERDDQGRVIWQAHATCSHTDATRRALTFRASPLARVRLRKSEQVHATRRRIMCVIRQEGRTIDLGTITSPLIAPSDREGYVFIGHKLYRRGKVTRKNSARDDARTVRRAIVARTLPSATIESRQGWDELVSTLAPGDRFKARVNGTYVLTLTRSPLAGKFNLRLMADAPVGKSGRVALNLQVRSAATVARRLHAAVI